MVGFDSAAHIWLNLREYYTYLNRAKIGQYKILLCNTKMQAFLKDYLLKIKSIIDTLTSIGHPTFAQDHIDAIFNGLPAYYNVFISLVNTRTEAYSVPKIEALLMAQEVQLDKAAKDLDVAKTEANLAHTKSQAGRGSSSFSPNPTGFGSGQFNRELVPIPLMGSLETSEVDCLENMVSPPFGGQKSQCKLCHKLGHTVYQCFYKFDKTVTGPESFQTAQGNNSANIVEVQAYSASREVVNDLD
uniref:Retrovirus-related Pol polyprotein from transposon TNT 1-94 n=1 Tax=Cannabis sativa TaxID=3483 RepID=A0A803NTT0_CANSA